MKKVNIGRPKGKAVLCKDNILKEALYLIDKRGPQGLSMRSLASRLKVTPMAIYNHFPDRSTLLLSLADVAYKEVNEKYLSFSGNLKERLLFLLEQYHKAVIRHPNLSISIFENANTLSGEVQTLTNTLLKLLVEANISETKRKMWLDILVDFTHGSSIAIALNQTNESDRKNKSLRYKKELKMILNILISRSSG